MSTTAASSQSVMMGLFNANHVDKAPKKAKKSLKSNVIVLDQEGPALLANTSRIFKELTVDGGIYHVIEWRSHKMSGYGMAIVKDEQESNLILYVAAGGKMWRIVANEMHDDLDENASLFVKVLGPYTSEPSQLSEVVAAVESYGASVDKCGRFSDAPNCTVVSYSTAVMKKIKQPTIIVKALKGNLVPRKGVYICKWRTTNLGGFGLVSSIPRKSRGEILLYSETEEDWEILQPENNEFEMHGKMCVWILMEYRKVKLLDEKQLVAQLQEDDEMLRVFIQSLRNDYADE